jgi:hypothetical protein
VIAALLEIFGELLLQLFGELLVEMGWRAVAEPFEREPRPWLAMIGYVAFGAALGGLSLLVVPHHLSPAGLWRWLNLIVTPVVVGLCMSALGAWRARRGQALYRIDRLLYGYLFALSLAVVRFIYAA